MKKLILSVLVIVEEIILKGNFGGIFLYLSMILVIVEALFDFSFAIWRSNKSIRSYKLQLCAN